MLSNREIKIIRSLRYKKYRIHWNVYVAEGKKLVTQLLRSNTFCKLLIGSATVIKDLSEFRNNIKRTVVCNQVLLNKISQFKNPSKIIGIFEIRPKSFNKKNILQTVSILLDDVQNPGNMGTIIRTADWFGINHIFCSEDCADIYNPKVVQASMGAIENVNIAYGNLAQLIHVYKDETFPIYGTFLSGENLFNIQLPNKGFVIIGNEGKGISENIEKIVTHRLFIPPKDNHTATESLNAATVTAIVCAAFRTKL